MHHDNNTAMFKYMFMFKHIMAVKTITVTENAYAALRAMKERDESFSEAILRISSSRVGNSARWFGTLTTSPEKLRVRVAEWRSAFDKDAGLRGKRLRKRQ